MDRFPGLIAILVYQNWRSPMPTKRVVMKTAHVGVYAGRLATYEQGKPYDIDEEQAKAFIAAGWAKDAPMPGTVPSAPGVAPAKS